MGVLFSLPLSLSSVERDEGCQGDIAVEVKQGSFSWDDEETQTILKGLNLEVKKGQLAAIVGTVGPGKSSLLAAIMGEMNKISGKVRVCDTAAYAAHQAQTSRIQNATIQKNILFDNPMDRHIYKDVIRACSLEKDLEIMEFGHQTEIGERGINLSGGQKQPNNLLGQFTRIALFIVWMMFSVQSMSILVQKYSRNAKHVRGVLKDKTVLLVTHQVDFVHDAELIMVMREGTIVQSGRYNES